MRARIHALSGAYALEVALEVVDEVERARFKAASRPIWPTVTSAATRSPAFAPPPPR